MKLLKLRSLSLLTIILIVLISGYSFTKRNSDVQTISGTITNVNHPIATLKTDDGKEYTIHMGPYWFWNDNNYSLSTNTVAEIKGEVNGTDIYPWTILQNSKTMTFTDDKGTPKWGNGNCPYRDGSGKGRGNGNGWGRGKCWRNK